MLVLMGIHTLEGVSVSYRIGVSVASYPNVWATE